MTYASDIVEAPIISLPMFSGEVTKLRSGDVTLGGLVAPLRRIFQDTCWGRRSTCSGTLSGGVGRGTGTSSASASSTSGRSGVSETGVDVVDSSGLSATGWTVLV